MSPMETEKLQEVLNGLGLDEKMYLLSILPTDMLLTDLRKRYEEMSDVIDKVKGVFVEC